jgi:uncharacterized membrane protein YbhN (UPF0104 family)
MSRVTTDSAHPVDASPGVNTGARRTSAVLMWLAKIAGAVLLLVFLIDHVSLRGMWDALGRARAAPAVFACVLLIPNLAVQHAKWLRLVRRVAPGISRREVFASLLAGYALGVVTPARVGEFAGRAAFLPSLGRSLTVSLTAVDKFFPFTVTVAAGLASAIVFTRYAPVDPIAFTASAAVLAICAIAWSIVALGWRPRRLTGALRHIVRRVAPGAVAPVLAELRRLTTMDAIVSCGWAVVYYATFSAQFLLLLLAFAPVRILPAFAAVGCILLAKTVIPPVTIGELGVREGAAVAVLSLIEYPAPAALNAALMLFVVNLLIPALAGGVVMLVRTARGRRR